MIKKNNDDTSWNVPIGETPTMTLGMLEVFSACTPAFLRLALCERERKRERKVELPITRKFSMIVLLFNHNKSHL